MACPVCLQAFDLREVRPKALPCGHSVCQSCSGNIEGNEKGKHCPTCRAAFEMPLPDNFALVERLEALQLEGPRWCMDCNSPADAQCMKDHEVMRPKTALRLISLQDVTVVVSRASQVLQGLQDGLPGLQDGAALTTLRLLRGPPATCRLTLRQDDGEAFGAEWRVDGQGGEDSLLQTHILALAASGRLLQEPGGVHADAQQPADDRIEKLDLHALSCSYPPADQREDKAETLREVRQRGVRRMTKVYCHSDPDLALDVLRSAAPTLEELEVLFGREEHLAAVHGMPRLQRLELYALEVQRPVELPALPRPSCLKWLRVWRLPRATAVSLLQAHAASLDVLWLNVCSEEEWAYDCDDLDALLGQCGLRLTRLVLCRDEFVLHDSSCFAQLQALRRVLPGCTVQCDKCDRVQLEAF